MPTALDRVVERLERQIRDHHGKRRKRTARPDALDSTRPGADADDTADELREENWGERVAVKGEPGTPSGSG